MANGQDDLRYIDVLHGIQDGTYRPCECTIEALGCNSARVSLSLAQGRSIVEWEGDLPLDQAVMLKQLTPEPLM